MLHDYQKAVDKANAPLDKGLVVSPVHKVVHMLFYCKNLIGMTIKILYVDSSEFPAKCPYAFV